MKGREIFSLGLVALVSRAEAETKIMNLNSVLGKSVFEDTKVGWTERKPTAFQVNQPDPLPFLSPRQLEGFLKEKQLVPLIMSH